MKKYKITTYVNEDKLAEMVAAVSAIAPVSVSESKLSDVTPKVSVAQPVVLTPPRQPRGPRGRMTRDTEPGKILLSVFNNRSLARGADLAQALKDNGYAWAGWCSVAAKLVSEGALYKQARGTYRLPTPFEVMDKTPIQSSE